MNVRIVSPGLGSTERKIPVPDKFLLSDIANDPRQLTRLINEYLGIKFILLRILGEGHVEVELIEDELRNLQLISPDSRAENASSERVWHHRPGWFNDVIAALRQKLERRGIMVVGPVEQMRFTSVTSLFLIPTDVGDVWLKVGPSIFSHESAIIQWMRENQKNSVPDVVGNGKFWWASLPFPEKALNSKGDFLGALVDIQKSSVNKVQELIDLGCPRRPLTDLTSELIELTERTHFLGPDENSRLQSLLPRLAIICDKIEDIGYPPVLVHGDLHPGNVRWTRKGWFLFDWTDSCITHPFVDLALPLSYDPLSFRGDRAYRFAAAWKGLMSKESIKYAIMVAPVIGIAHQAVSYKLILRGINHKENDILSREDLVPWLRYWTNTLISCLASHPMNQLSSAPSAVFHWGVLDEFRYILN